jgi:hypothetical protein
MFSLSEQIGCAHLGVHRAIGDHHCLGWAGKKIDADTAVELALGFRHKRIARSDKHVDRFDRFGTKRHSAHRLHAAEHIDLVGACLMHCGDDRRMRLALLRRRSGNDAWHAGDGGRKNRHMS